MHTYRYKFIGNLWAGKQSASAGVIPIQPKSLDDCLIDREKMRAEIKKLNPDFAVITDFELFRVEQTNALHTVTDSKGIPLEVSVETRAKYRLIPWAFDTSEALYIKLATS